MAISLSKGQRISLEKQDGGTLDYIEIGVNWGAIEKKGFFGGKKHVAVDLDASVGLFDAQGNLVDTVFFQKLTSSCGSIKHSGDDRVGDTGGDDGQDNEVIQIDLKSVPANVDKLALVLNSFSMQNFGEIPFAGIRIHDGKAGKGNIFATFDVANDPSFSGRVSMIMGSVYRHENTWKFRSIGAAIPEKRLQDSLAAFARDYAN
ncbi:MULTISPECIES: TerD family protein [Modicisalibacter]|uniref:TerD family protein n=1 Tax=Modicisalibacter TaxID=574347 RepID=UPI00100B6C36|nr:MULTISPECIES: TerD family protein [Halomonadaceae]MBZ9559124.1 TerD family protein [Modicisalibacter sp. R2A 31.J]MBZ9576711.1 TerD family protein [Modicisalibacter sp. MOD 31.J]